MLRPVVLSVCALLLATGAQAAYQETWNDPSATENYWQTDFSTGGTYWANWQADGGIGDTGHIYVEIDELALYPDYGDASFPAWLYPQTADQQGVDFAGQTVRISTLASSGFDLDGTLHLYLGTWFPGSPEDEYYFYHDTPIGVSSAGWQETLLDVGTDGSGWSVLYRTDAALDVTDVWSMGTYDNWQYGFAIIPDTAAPAPTGTLRLDNFIVPEPATLALMALAGVAVLRRRRK
jgi:hypothetical protein